MILETFIVQHYFSKTRLSLFFYYQISILLLQYYKSITRHYLEIRCTNQSALNTYSYYGYLPYLRRVHYYCNPVNHAILLRINKCQSLNYWRCK